MTEKKALVSEIDYGFVKVNGLLHPTDGYGIAVSQICEFLSFTKNHGSRDIKRIMGKDFQFSHWKSELHPKAVNVISIKEFAILTYFLAKKGNELAEAFILAAAEETHERRFNNAFGKRIEEEDYNQRLKLRIERVSARQDWTVLLLERHIDLYGKTPTPNDYRAWTTEVNWALFNRPNFNRDRDNMTPEQQAIILDFERTAIRLANKYPKDTPSKIIQRALDTF